MNEIIEDIVRNYVPFLYGETSKGWNRVYCDVCGDGSRRKGPRGGWLFQDKMAFYHCFNCGVEGNFDPDREHAFSKDMPNILEKFMVPIKECKALLFANLKQAKTKPENKTQTIKTLDLPDHFYKLKDCDDSNIIAVEARKYLLNNYGLTDTDYEFYLSTGQTSSSNVTEKSFIKLLVNRIIIPFYRNEKLVYYQARDITDKSKLKYLSPDISKANILFNSDMLYKNMDMPLYILEGAFDAIHVNGIAVTENKMSKQQIDIINKSPKQKILIPDFIGDSFKLAEQAIENEWDISIPKFGNCKDISAAIVKYGKLYVLNEIKKCVYSGSAAKVALALLKTRNIS